MSIENGRDHDIVDFVETNNWVRGFIVLSVVVVSGRLGVGS